MSLTLRLAALQQIYAALEEWLRHLPIVCGKGCATCCTQSVTVTSLEGRFLLAHLQANGRVESFRKTILGRNERRSPGPTINQWAKACLEGREEADGAAAWDFTPWPFLEKNLCTVYEARPFGCRSFISLSPCAALGAAEVPPLVVTVSTMAMQLIEHLDRGGCWGHLLNVLDALLTEQENPGSALQKKWLRPASPCPGFLIPPEERETVNRVQDLFFQLPVAGIPLGTVLNLTDPSPVHLKKDGSCDARED